MIVVTGATGKLGRLVVAGLREHGVPVTAAARDVLADLPVEIRQADYDQPETLMSALKGAAKVLLISGNAPGRRITQHTAVIDAARRVGVQHLVYTSILHADSTRLVLAPEHKATEEAIRTSGIPYTFLRNGWYNENYADTITRAAESGEMVGAAGDGRVASAARADFAGAAVTVLVGAGHEYRVYELSGDTAWTHAELATEVAAVAGRPVEYRNLTPESFRAYLVEGGAAQEAARVAAALDAGIAAGELADTPGDLRVLLGRPTTPIRVTVAAVLRR